MSDDRALVSLVEEAVGFLNGYRRGDEDMKALYALRLFDAVNMVTLGIGGKEYNYLVEHPDVEAVGAAAIASRKCFDTTPADARVISPSWPAHLETEELLLVQRVDETALI